MFPSGDEHSELHDKNSHKPLAKLVVKSADGRPLSLDDLELAMSPAAASRLEKKLPRRRLR